VASLALSADGRTIFSNGYDKVGRLWDRETGKELRRCEGDLVAEEAAFSPDGRQLLAGAFLFDVATGKRLRVFANNAPGVYGAAVSPDGKRALAGCTDYTVRLWDVETGEELRCFRGHEGYVRGVAFSPDGRLALSCSWDNTVRLWRLPD
jgi:WD40 repeat protein